MQPIQGIHHITAMAGDPRRNVRFYTEILGQRLIKKTVNFDDPGTYHLYYADRIGTPGTVITFFPWPNARRGRPGNGEVAALAYSIRPQAFDFWWQRLTDHHVHALTRDVRFGRDLMGFHDPDGMRIELIVDEEADWPAHWEDGPIPAEYALGAFHSVTMWVDGAHATARLLTEEFGYAQHAEEGARLRYKAAADDYGVYVDLVERPGQPAGQMGAGSVHHVAFRTVDDAEQAEYRTTLLQAGHAVTTVQDRQYFHSIYFREPGGTLFEIATDGPGFTWDESEEQLGSGLMLPPWYEEHRNRIEAVLPPLDQPIRQPTDSPPAAAPARSE